MRPDVRPVRLGVACLALISLAACGGPSAQGLKRQGLSAAPPAAPAHEVAVPALRGGRLRPDVLVSLDKPMPAKEVRDLVALGPGAVAFTAGTVRLLGKDVQVASVDPVTFRRYTPAGTAESTAVWQVVANGGVIASHALAKRLHLTLGGDVSLVGRSGLVTRLGALATTGVPHTDLVVGTATGQTLGLSGPTAVLLNAGSQDPIALAAKARALAGRSADVELLTAPAANPIAFLTGSRAARAFGAFSYTYSADGTLQPDLAWVRANIVTERVPILGAVTCHRLMLPQLRAALTDVVRAGLASKLHSYNGCYVPKFIERSPTHAISLHTWGIAIDMDTATNGRGTKGTMDPRVVAIFKRWGFRWGGDWSWTDPMHFEIAALLTTP